MNLSKPVLREMKQEYQRQPLVSICIPTYNRADSIETLFSSLKKIKENHGSDIEICLSNNKSSDNTDQTIARWKYILDLKVIVQATNIGGTLNAIEVTKLATGRWIQIIGDDDIFYPDEFSCLVSFLKKQKPEIWVLVGVKGAIEQGKLFESLTSRSYPSRLFRTILVQSSLNPYGFIGMHIIPSAWLTEYHKLSLNNTRGWPHLALFVRYLLKSGDVFIYKKNVVEQAVGASVLFWNIGDWVRVGLGRVDLVDGIEVEMRSNPHFLHLIVLREIYAPAGVKNMILWKALEEQDFNENAIKEYLSRYCYLGISSILTLPHSVLLMFLRFIPARIIKFTMLRLGYGRIITDYDLRKATMTEFDGIKRVL